MTRLILFLPAVFLALAAPPSTAQTWTDLAGDGNWNNASNWVPSGIPNSASAAPIFSNEGGRTINISSTVLAGSLNFTGVGAASFTLTSSAGQVLDYLTAINYLMPSDTGTQTINLAYNGGGNMSFGSIASGGNLTIANNSSGSLVIGPNTVIGSENPNGNGGLVFFGTGNTTLSGSFAQNSYNPTGGLTVNGPGTLDFSGDGTHLFGGLTLNGGTLILDYTTNAATKLGSGYLNLLGGQLVMNVNAAAVTQFVSGTNLAASHTEISASGPASNNAITLNLGAITRSPGATVDFSSNGPTLIPQTSTGNTNGLLGAGQAYATTGLGANWATNNSGFIGGLTSYGPDTYSAGTNTDFVSPTQSLGVSSTTNSIRFNNNSASGNNLYLTNANLTLQSGGILMTPNSGSVVIQDYYGGEALTAGGTGELLVHQYNTANALEIDSNIVAYGGLTKTGPGTLILGGNNNLGTINVNQGSLTVTLLAAVNSAFTINLNDNVQAHGGQYLTFEFGNFVNRTVGCNIRMGTPTYGSAFGTGSSTNSIVTLSGVISSIPGMSTPLYIGLGQDITSGINLTGNNTFLGTVNLNGGTLGINSNASLGNAANTLVLAVGSSSAGGLEFLNGGVNLAQPVDLFSGVPTRIVSNGSDVNTISGVISDYQAVYYGGARLYKAGTGSLILTNVNTYSGGTEIDAGTLSVGADYSLGAVLAPVAINAGGTLGISSSFATARPLLLGPNPATGASGATSISVAAGQTFMPTGGISDNISAGALTLTGPGTVVLNSPNTYSGGTSVQEGTLLVGMDNALGAASASVAIGPLGTLTYTASVSTSRTFTLNSGTLSVAAGQTLTLNGATIGGGFMRGTGAYVLTGGTALIGVTTPASATFSVTGPASFVNFTNGSPLTIAAGLVAPTTFNFFTNQGSGSITLGAGSQINASDFQTYGLLILTPANGTGKTLLTNVGTSPLYFNGGSQTFIGTIGGNGQAQLELNGQNAIVAGGLLVNNGHVTDNSVAGISTIIADYGALVKGAGSYDNSPITQNGGKFQAGNSPGVATVGRFVFGPGGVSSYVFAIDDATGQAGPTPDALGHVSGWGLVKAAQWQRAAGATSGDFVWTADAAHPLTIAIDTLVNPTTAGTDVSGLMADFDPTKSYSWPAVEWTGTYSGPTDVAALDAATDFDTSGFINPVEGTFGWSLGNSSLSLSYTPSVVPEPGTLALVGIAAAFGGWRRRWRSITCR